MSAANEPLRAAARQYVALMSDTVFYKEAVDFAQEHGPIGMKQLVSLMGFSRSWDDLIKHVRHQVGRDWVNREEVKQFYIELQRYLSDSRRGLVQRVKTEFNAGIREFGGDTPTRAPEYWAQLFAQEFMQHLVAEARLRTERLG